MPLTYILVDFENVQPSAADAGLVRGDELRLAIFRGPGQMKYAADLAEAWQPLGPNLTFIRCAKAGRNAVDMHIAFYLGELVAAQKPQAATRFVIVSRDSDFDPLLMHIRSQGYEATRVASIRAALDGRAEGTEARPAKSRNARAAPAKTARAGAATASTAGKSAAKKAASKPAATKDRAAKPAPKDSAAGTTPRKPASRPARKSIAAPPAAARNAATPDARSKVIESLQRMGDKRPAKRKGLERHIESHLGRKLESGVLPALMLELERDGVLVFNDNKVEYRLPKPKK